MLFVHTRRHLFYLSGVGVRQCRAPWPLCTNAECFLRLCCFSVSLRVAEIVSRPDRSSDGSPYTEAGILRSSCRSTSARHSFPADGACRGRTRLEEVPALSSRPELASKLRPVSHTGGSRLLQKLEVTGSPSFGGVFAELLEPGLLASLIAQVEKTITTSQYPCKMRKLLGS